MDSTFKKIPKFPTLTGLIFLILLSALMPVPAADTGLAGGADGKTNEANQESLRSYLQIQEELHNTQLAIEKIRQEAQATATTNSQMLEARLSQMEKTLAAQRLEEFKSIERSDRMVLIAAGVFAVTGFLVLFVAAFLQWTAINRLANAAASLTAAREPAALGRGEAHLLPGTTVEQSSARFVSVIEQLEQRIHDLEATAKLPPGLLEKSHANEKPRIALMPVLSDDALVSLSRDSANPMNLLLGKGETLLKLDKPEAALACLEEALLLDPGHVEALLKKGTALERLQRFDEAIACYDRAIARDNSMTMAYLHKGGVFNRMERYSEALECYELALKTRQKEQTARMEN